MNNKRKLLQNILRIFGFGLGSISILGGIMAFQHTSELERYWVSAIVMICSGVLWLISSLFSKFRLTQKQHMVSLGTLLVGIILGLFDTFLGCGGECGGTGFCHWMLGYPGRWLRISNCMAGFDNTAWWVWYMLKGTWTIDLPSFAADIVFWSGAGLIFSSIGKLSRRSV